jgi:hypothetical protein
MSQSIKSLRKAAANLQRKINKERRRQELVVELQRNILTLSEEYSTLRQDGSETKLFEQARDGVYRND